MIGIGSKTACTLATLLGISVASVSMQTSFAQAQEIDSQPAATPPQSVQTCMFPGGMGGGGMGGGGMGCGCFGYVNLFPSAPVRNQTAEEMKLAASIRDRLTQPFELDLDSIPVEQLAESLSQQTELPFMLDLGGIAYAKVDKTTAVTHQSSGRPLKVALRQFLEPLGLQADVRDDSVVITADFAALSRQGHPTTQWISMSDAACEKINEALDKEVSFAAEEQPLQSVLETLSADIGVPILIDEAALEESGVNPEHTVNLKIKNVSARSLLQKVLRDLGLTLTMKREWLEVSTEEVVSEDLLRRIYWLDGLGEYNSNFESLFGMIQSNIEPDEWEDVGGASTMISVRNQRPFRSGIVVATKMNMHEEIENLLETLRKSNFGPDQFGIPAPPPAAAVVPVVGGPAAPAQSGGMF